MPSTTSGASVCKLGAGGVLTEPNDDRRTWFWAHFYADGEGVLTASSTPDATREIVASGRICAIGKYVGLEFTPWDGVTGPTHRQHFYSCSTSPVGGNGTAWASNKTAYTYFRIDTASTPGYMTAA